LAGLLALIVPALAQETTTMVPVATLENPRQLTCMDVVNPGGDVIGTISGVKVGSDGKASRVIVVFSTGDGNARATADAPVGQARIAAIRPERLTLNIHPPTEDVVANYSAAQITQLTRTASYSKARGFKCQSGSNGGRSEWR
jgi:hypothetical protein